MTEITYVLGHSSLELERLKVQAEILAGMTRRLLLEAGLKQGMRVLDIGCGLGDVATLAAAIVGPSGSVVAIDQSREAIEVSQARAMAEGWTNIEFRQAAVEDFIDEQPFDLAVGRYVLVHQPDPVRMIAASAARVRPGGAVVFHEIVADVDCLIPISPFLASLMNLLSTSPQAVVTKGDAGFAMPEFFDAAGLKDINMSCEVPIGYGDSPIARWISLTLQTALPHLLANGVVSPGELDFDAIERRLQEEGMTRRRPLIMPLQLLGWARVQG